MTGARIGCLAAVVGLLAVFAGCAVLAWTLKRATEARRVDGRTLTLGEPGAFEATVSTDRQCQVAVAFTVTVPKEAMAGVTNAHSVPYEVPVRYRVEDLRGGTLVDETLTAQPARGTRVLTGDTVGTEGGTVRIRHLLAKFVPPADGRMKVVATVGAAGQPGPESAPVAASDPEVELFDNVTVLTRPVGVGFGVAGVGAFIAVVGAAFWLGMRTRAERPA